METVWLVTPTARTHAEYAPLGMAFLAADLRGRGYRVAWDLLPPGAPDPDALARRARELAPRAVVVSSAPRFYCTCPVPTVGAALATARAVRSAAPGARRIAVGPVATVRPNLFLGEFDVVARGDPEPVVGPAVAAESAAACGEVPGASVAGRDAPPAPYADLASLPPPARDLLPMERFVFESHFARRTTAIQAARGCPFACTFCFINRDDGYARANSGRPLRARPAELVSREIGDLRARHGIDGLFFEDSEFGVRRDHAAAIAGGIARDHPGVRWSAQMRVTSVDRPFLAELAASGCREIFYGVESGDPALLASTGKGVDLDAIASAFAWTREAGIRTTASFILGLPGETPATVEATVRLARRLRPDHASFHLFSPYDGTRLHGEARAAGFLPDDAPDRIRVHANLRGYRTATMSAEDLAAARRRAYRAFYLSPGYLARRLLGASFREMSFYARTVLGLRGSVRTAEASVLHSLFGRSDSQLVD